MKQLPTLLFVFLSITRADAQFYCGPTFDNGCVSWRTIAVSAGSIVWGDDLDCTYSDHTDLTTTVSAGEQIPMTVENGAWCGCAVWVDLDNDSEFAETENLFYSYVGGSPSYIYEFAITIPEGTSVGAHRMRVVSPWGSDGFLSTNTNGFGPCGAYAYGNFDDFTINVEGNENGVNEIGNTATPLIVSPNPTQGPLSLKTDDGTPLTRVTVMSTDGRVVQQHQPLVRTGAVQLDLAGYPTGMYIVQCFTDAGMRTVQVAKY